MTTLKPCSQIFYKIFHKVFFNVMSCEYYNTCQKLSTKFVKKSVKGFQISGLIPCFTSQLVEIKVVNIAC